MNTFITLKFETNTGSLFSLKIKDLKTNLNQSEVDSLINTMVYYDPFMNIDIAKAVSSSIHKPSTRIFSIVD